MNPLDHLDNQMKKAVESGATTREKLASILDSFATTPSEKRSAQALLDKLDRNRASTPSIDSAVASIIESEMGKVHKPLYDANLDLDATLRANAAREGIAKTRDKLHPGVAKLFREFRPEEGQAVVKKLAALEALEVGSFRVEKPEGSQLHHLIEAVKVNSIIDVAMEGTSATKVSDVILKQDWQVFLVEHNWAGAFAKADEIDGGSILLPYPACAFEMRIDGYHAISLLMTPETNPDQALAAELRQGSCAGMILVFLRTRLKPWWAFFGSQILTDDGLSYIYKAPSKDAKEVARLSALGSCFGRQIRAISIALEARVAEKEIVRAPFKLNRKREQGGKLPIYDHHVVNLSRRGPRGLPRDRDLIPNEDKRRAPRLHFRRGHWRHYATHKTRIAWMLVGNHDLGFIDKEYRL